MKALAFIALAFTAIASRSGLRDSQKSPKGLIGIEQPGLDIQYGNGPVSGNVEIGQRGSVDANGNI